MSGSRSYIRAMTTTRIVCIRHGESTFNVHHEATGRDPGHVDARLSEKGHRQVAAARESLRSVPFELVVTSPLTRALQTTAGIFADHPMKPAILVEVLHRECQESSCDIGRAASVLAEEFSEFRLDHLPEIWWHAEGAPGPGGYHTEPRSAFEARVASFRQWLRVRPERVIAVVGHSTFFQSLTGRWMRNCEAVDFTLDEERPRRAFG